MRPGVRHQLTTSTPTSTSTPPITTGGLCLCWSQSLLPHAVSFHTPFPSTPHLLPHPISFHLCPPTRLHFALYPVPRSHHRLWLFSPSTPTMVLHMKLLSSSISITHCQVNTPSTPPAWPTSMNPCTPGPGALHSSLCSACACACVHVGTADSNVPHLICRPTASSDGVAVPLPAASMGDRAHGHGGFRRHPLWDCGCALHS